MLDHDDTLLVTIGYSFNDEHINTIIFECAATRPRMHVVSLQYEQLPPENDLVKQAGHRSNLIVLGPDKAIIGTKEGSWQLQEPIDEKTTDFMCIAFDSDKAKDGEKEGTAITGKVKLGDFNCFARFLDSIVYWVK